MNLALTYSTNKEGVEKVVAEIRALEGEGEKLRISIHQVDVGDVEAIGRLFEEVKERHGGRVVDVLVSNAGYGRRIVDVWFVNPFSFRTLFTPLPSVSPTGKVMRGSVLTMGREIPLEEFDKTININLRASFVLVKGVVEGMKNQNWGRIVFMSSIAAYGGGINGCRMFFPTHFFFPQFLEPLSLFFYSIV